MTAPPLTTRTVRVPRNGRAAGYFDALLGLDIRMPAVVESGRVLAGYLIGVVEDEDGFTLEFSGLAPEG